MERPEKTTKITAEKSLRILVMPNWKMALSIALLSLGLAGCSSTPKQSSTQSTQLPSWVTQPPVASGMAYGVGSMENYGNPADAVKRAADMATADLVSQLKVTVSSEFTSSTSYSSGTHQPSAMQENVSQYIQSKTPVAELDEIKTINTWLDERYAYALVELDRNQAAARLRRDMADIELDLQRYAILAPQGSRLQQVQALLPALPLFAQRERLSERLALVSMERRNEPLPEALKALKQQIYQQIDQLTVSLELVNNDAQSLRASLIEGLTQQGLRLQNSAQADLRFIIKAELSDKRQGGSHHSFAYSQIVIEDANGRALSSFSKQAKGTSGMADVAAQKAAQQLAQIIATELAVTLTEKIR